MRWSLSSQSPVAITAKRPARVGSSNTRGNTGCSLARLKGEDTDAIWVYWSQDPRVWNPAHKAVVLDGSNCNWSHDCIGMPSVVKLGDKLALFYDAPGGDSISHMRRHIGLAWLDLPLTPQD